MRARAHTHTSGPASSLLFSSGGTRVHWKDVRQGRPAHPPPSSGKLAQQLRPRPACVTPEKMNYGYRPLRLMVAKRIRPSASSQRCNLPVGILACGLPRPESQRSTCLSHSGSDRRCQPPLHTKQEFSRMRVRRHRVARQTPTATRARARARTQRGQNRAPNCRSSRS